MLNLLDVSCASSFGTKLVLDRDAKPDILSTIKNAALKLQRENGNIWGQSAEWVSSTQYHPFKLTLFLRALFLPPMPPSPRYSTTLKCTYCQPSFNSIIIFTFLTQNLISGRSSFLRGQFRTVHFLRFNQPRPPKRNAGNSCFYSLFSCSLVQFLSVEFLKWCIKLYYNFTCTQSFNGMFDFDWWLKPLYFRRAVCCL